MVALKQYIAQLRPTLAGKFLYYAIPFRKQVVLQNMRQVLGEQLTEAEIIHLAKSFYAHLATSLKENLFMRFKRETALSRQVQVIGEEILLNLIKHHKGVLILTGHFGNWEFAPVAGILNFKDFKGRFYFIRKTLKNKWLEQWLFRRYYRAGLQVIPKKNSLNQVCDVLERNNAVIFVMDQHASRHSKDGIMVDFFGKKAGTYRSLAMIAKYTGAPVVPAASYRKPDGQHVLQFHEPLPLYSSDDTKAEIYHNTLKYNQALEQLVMAHPEQWLWMHKRWKA